MLSDRVKKLKKEKKLTNEELALKSGIPIGTLNKILNGTTIDPKLSTATTLAKALDCTIDYLVYEEVPEIGGNQMAEKPMVNKIKFAERLKRLMEASSETVYSIAEIVHLSAPTISRYLNAEMAAKITTIEAIARHFRVNPVWLLGYDVPERLVEEKQANSQDDNDDIFTRAAHKVGHDGPLTEEEKEKIALAIKIALMKNKE
ncbi:putative transcriptional regulator [Clostridium aceticum]|uniref:Putative transcriptional regulator n=1 Tax=Clostridium aceticum TaxID=84022 RepID=A0A0G3WE67_9CLOT|nr:helix-turn-helix transcriptional regulator [Clostridium aceticum]AKL96663.1 putative transcriptional regulator [Clostridium aceticum]